MGNMLPLGLPDTDARLRTRSRHPQSDRRKESGRPEGDGRSEGSGVVAACEEAVGETAQFSAS